MPRKACCCGKCPWCNRDDKRQPNYEEIRGTLTTEVPSVGHGSVLDYIDNTVYYDYYTGQSLLRTPAPSQAYWAKEAWGPNNAYGDVQPCWFNGINMKNDSPTAFESFFKFKFKLKINKKVGNQKQTLVNIDWNGYGTNLRPHPDSCGSYNITSKAFAEDEDTERGCGIFGGIDENNPITDCVRDFAKMPRGPWPYRLKRNLQPNFDNPNCHYNEDINDQLFTTEQVQDAQANPGQGIAIVQPQILNCDLLHLPCDFPNPNNPISPYYQCCTKLYCSNKEFCNALDTEGTPFGWEDVPYLCPKMSNYNSSEENMKFFCWWNPHNRYTTPEWDVVDFTLNQSRKMSIHVVVPSTTTDFCYLNDNISSSYGEWAFGMDLEAPEEIGLLESNGFVFSNGREDKGVWINKTPTGALRVLFTLDHGDLAPGKVWRVFNDWNVKSAEMDWDRNVNTGTEFTIEVEQVLDELAFSSLGCDCPSGGSGYGPDACNVPIAERDYVYENCWGVPKISFSERGPLAIRFYADTDNSGYYNCEDPTAQPGNPGNIKISTKSCPSHGTIMIVDAGVLPDVTTINSYPNQFTYQSGTPYLEKYGDIPGSHGSDYGINVWRYRNLYTTVDFSQINYENIMAGSWTPYRTILNAPDPTIYGSVSCTYDYGGQPFFQYMQRAVVSISPYVSITRIGQCTATFRCDPDCGNWTTIDNCPPISYCTYNLVTYGNLPSSANPFEHCTFEYGCRPEGAIHPMCKETISLFGIDSDNIYFDANASETGVPSVGNINCWESCLYPWVGNVDPNCYTQDGCNFALGRGDAHGGGFVNTFIKWRKYYCNKGYYQFSGVANEYPQDLMGKLVLTCDTESNCANSTTKHCGCQYFWRYASCGDVQNAGPIMYANDDFITQNQVKYEVKTEKYDNLFADTQFGAYDTNYSPNSFVAQRRVGQNKYLTITQKRIIR